LNILVLSTYPIDTPRHGGQIRVSNLVKKYKQIGFNVEVAGVLGSDLYPKSDGFDNSPSIVELEKVISPSFLMEDYAIGRLYENNTKYFEKLSQKIKATPRIIHVEHPWLMPFALRYRKESTQNIKIIYGSANVEHKLKRSILTSHFGNKETEEKVNLIKAAEIEAIKKADGILCVSEGDVKWTKEYANCPILLAPNGVEQWGTSKAGSAEANNIVQRHKFALFCASAHPPNVTGFFEMFKQGFGSLSPSEKLVIVGSAGAAIEQSAELNKSACLSERILSTGMLNTDCLAALLDRAHCIVLPITQGGGTNLKTAEAIWAGHYVLATTIAMRGFEQYINTPGVYIADTATEFKKALRHIMALPPLKLKEKEQKQRESVLWNSTLEGLTGYAKKIESSLND